MSTSTTGATSLLHEYQARFEQSLTLLKGVPYTEERLALYTQKVMEILLEQVTKDERVNLSYIKSPFFTNYWISEKHYKSSPELRNLAAEFLQQVSALVLKFSPADQAWREPNLAFELIKKDLNYWIIFWFTFVYQLFRVVQYAAVRIGLPGTMIPQESFWVAVEEVLKDEDDFRLTLLLATYDFLLDKYGWEKILQKYQQDLSASTKSKIAEIVQTPDEQDLEQFRDTQENPKLSVEFPSIDQPDSETSKMQEVFEMPSDEIWAIDDHLKGFFPGSND